MPLSIYIPTFNIMIMKKIKFAIKSRRMLADTITPVSIYLRVRDVFPNSILLESSDYHNNEDSYSFICLQPIATFSVNQGIIAEQLPGNFETTSNVSNDNKVTDRLNDFIKKFECVSANENAKVNGIFGYTSYDAVQYFENIKFDTPKTEYNIPEIRYSFYKYIISINHFKNELYLLENVLEGEESKLDQVQFQLINKVFSTYHFKPESDEKSNLTDEQYMEIVRKGKEHCQRGDVFQIVLSRQFSQQFSGDDFNVYRALRSINPSPYLFYFDFGSYKIFGSSPEAQLIISNGKATINPIAGTFKRTGDPEKDRELAEKLEFDPKENSEHVMLVDLARNDLSRNSKKVKVETYREVQYFSHVLHLVSKVTGKLTDGTNTIKVMGDTFPAGTLSGAPKHKAMQLIDKYENQSRGYYGGSIGYIGFNGDINQAILIRSFLSMNNTLSYQAGAGIVNASVEESELNEVNNKLLALKAAIEMAKDI